MPEETTKPFPARAVITLSCCFLVNIYTVTSVFPYLAYYVVEAGAAEDVDAAGYWSGVITAAFMVGRVIGAYPLGRAADRFGRKPVLFLGLATNAVLAVAFGSCRSIGAAVLTRFLTGLFNGIPIVARTSATELVADAALEDLAVAGAPGRGRPRPRAVVRGAAAPVDLRAGPVERREGAAGRERRVVDELREARAGPRAPLDAPERGAVERRDLGRDFAWAGKG